MQTIELKPTASSRMELIVEKTGLLKGKKHLFVFSQYKGALQFDKGRPENSSVRFTLDSRSILCKDTWLNAKDLAKVQEYAVKDMLNVAKYPEIVFASTKIAAASAKEYTVQGNLTIRDATRPVVVTVNNGAAAFRGSAIVRLTDFKLKPPSAGLGTIGTKDEMMFSFQLESPRV